ncbi:hypothetical protein HYH03_018415 [Edaphochlamys debaryana]|uniref:Methyltransferase domain-containing protein n=1 Tax=Edaphochlamys debaryana TaxID=47281 RepID=A0A836BN55_9CHLO|nr:hypothetical protein HYH03_018415 [Edaphochlamys debaryana]|eukprot:KAG2482680.1 hypothetical protein HYH03_018415 [Edaphochlamys debaryana]
MRDLTAKKPTSWLGADSLPCEVVHVGKGWGEHRLCKRAPARPCVFYSFGINRDYSFDTQYANETGCRGFGFDPTVNYLAQLEKNVTFLRMAATSLDENLNKHWYAVTSVPGFKKWQHHQQIAVLKMDCEGCEFAIAKDVAKEDPDFWWQVEQFAVEIHVPKKFMPTNEHVRELAHLFAQLEQAGLHLRDVMLTGCSPTDEASGCHPMLMQANFPCEPTKMCQNLLFAR